MSSGGMPSLNHAVLLANDLLLSEQAVLAVG
jgi:hypothetical protein